MTKSNILSLSVLLLGLAASSFAAPVDPTAVPEINAGTVGSAITLLAGGVLVIRGWKSR